MRSEKWTISDRIYESLRGSIMNLELKPGSEIRITEIISNLGVSRSPVRDALLKLEKDGLVDLLPQKGTFVSRIDLDRMHEERFLRESLEERTLELYLDMARESDFACQRDALVRQKTSLDEENWIDFLNQDDEFHRVFFEATHKRMCWHIIQSMSGHYRRIRLLVLRNKSIAEHNYRQHMELLDCVAKRDATGARGLMQDHLTRLIVEERELREEFPDYFYRRPFSGAVYTQN